MTYARRAFRRRIIGSGEPSGEVISWLDGGERWRAAGEPHPWSTLLSELAEELVQAWQRVRDDILAEWAEKRPGLRPRGWWCFERPEPLRRRLTGTGDHHSTEPRKYDRGPNWCTVEWGLPVYWLTRKQAAIYGGTPPDPHDPPTYESQAGYLKRHDLLEPAECARLQTSAFKHVWLEIAPDSGALLTEHFLPSASKWLSSSL